MNVIIINAIKVIAGLLFESGVFDRILAAVGRWANASFPEDMPSDQQNRERRSGVLHELNTIGLDVPDHLARLGLELAVAVKKRSEA